MESFAKTFYYSLMLIQLVRGIVNQEPPRILAALTVMAVMTAYYIGKRRQTR